MKLSEAITNNEFCSKLIVETGSEDRFLIKDNKLVWTESIMYTDDTDIVLPTKSELSTYGKMVRIFLEKYHPGIDLDLHRPGVARRLDEEYNLKYEYMEFEQKYLCYKLREWISMFVNESEIEVDKYNLY